MKRTLARFSLLLIAGFAIGFLFAMGGWGLVALIGGLVAVGMVFGVLIEWAA